ncbi:MAG TPA: nucleoside-diphosphate kinase [Blastocatellia bacterium]|nr:nucleoside-diphosphate kinase [Blastocatellia bacterium]
MEKTLILIKPDAIQRGLAGKIIERFESKGLKIVAIKFVRMTDELCAEHYSHLADKPFFPGIRRFMQQTPAIALCLEGVDCVETVRALCGITKARAAAPGTIRGDWAMSIQANLVHASDSVETAEKEVARFFNASELFDYETPRTQMIYAADELK